MSELSVLETNIRGPTGAAGPIGPAGSTGPPGSTGATGPQGVPGPTGSTGPPGTAGEKWFSGTGIPNDVTPAGAVQNDWYLDSATGTYYEKVSATSWTSRGNLKGPQGIQGPQGPSGPQGLPGSSTITSPLVIPDAVGIDFPTLRFASGDGQNAVGPNPYNYDWSLYNDELRLFSSRQPTVALAKFRRPAADVAQMLLQDFTLSRDADGYLRIWKGSNSTGNVAIGDGGDIWGRNVNVAAIASGAITSNAASSFQNLTVNNTIAGTGALALQSGGASYSAVYGSSNGSGVLVGHQYGVGDQNKVGVHASPPGNNWDQRPFTIAVASGAAAVGWGLYQAPNGWTGSMQLWYDGSYYIGCLNGANSAYVKSYASAFTVQSSRRFKGEIELAERRSLREVVRRIKPVRFRDLQDELSREASYFAPDDYRGPNGERIIANERFVNDFELTRLRIVTA